MTVLTRPSPNCGHADIAYTHIPLIQLWICTLCVASIGPLYRTCSRCGGHPAPGTQLATTTKGHLCTNCLRDYRAGHRGAS